MMKSLLKRVVFGSTTLGILATSFSVLAIPSHDPNAYDGGNVWWLTAYEDDSSNHGWKENRAVCFDPWYPLDMHAEYKRWQDVWSYPNFYLLSRIRGARQEGDQIFMVGDNQSADPMWRDSRQWEMTNSIKGYGHLQRWSETSESMWYNIELRRIKDKMCNCDSLASYFSTIDIHIDNSGTLEQLLSTHPACSSDEAEPAPSEEVAK